MKLSCWVEYVYFQWILQMINTKTYLPVLRGVTLYEQEVVVVTVYEELYDGFWIYVQFWVIDDPQDDTLKINMFIDQLSQ